MKTHLGGGRLLLVAAAAAACLAVATPSAGAYATTWDCWADAGSCNSSFDGNHSYRDSRAQKDGGNAQSICASMYYLSGGAYYELYPSNPGGSYFPCANNTTFRRSCYADTNIANRRANAFGSGHWIIHARAATASDSAC